MDRLALARLTQCRAVWSTATSMSCAVLCPGLLRPSCSSAATCRAPAGRCVRACVCVACVCVVKVLLEVNIYTHTHTHTQVLLEVNAVEIYNEVIRDLLSDDKSAGAPNLNLCLY